MNWNDQNSLEFNEMSNAWTQDKKDKKLKDLRLRKR
jgi:hypothetical protein